METKHTYSLILFFFLNLSTVFAGLIVNGPGQVCPGQTVTFTAQNIRYNIYGNRIDYTHCVAYTWKVYKGYNEAQIGAYYSARGVNTFTFTFPNEPGDYRISIESMKVQGGGSSCSLTWDGEPQESIYVNSNFQIQAPDVTVNCGELVGLNAQAFIKNGPSLVYDIPYNGCTYSWSGPQFPGSTSQSVYFTPTQSGIYTLTVTAPCGYVKQKQVNVTVNPAVLTLSNSITSTTNNISVCGSQPFTISAYAPNAFMFYWLKITGGQPQSAISKNPYTTSISENTRFIATAMFNNGCASQTKEINVTRKPTTVEAPSVSAIVLRGTGCATDPETTWEFTANALGASYYKWNVRVNGVYSYDQPGTTANTLIYARYGNKDIFPWVEGVAYIANTAGSICATSAPSSGMWAPVRPCKLSEVEENSESSDITSLYNLSGSTIDIFNPEKTEMKVSIYSMEGRAIKGIKAASEYISIDTDGITPGLYIVDIETSSNHVRNKIVVSK